MLTLRTYQQKLFDNVMALLIKGHKHILCYAAMRSGKTILFSYMALRQRAKNKKCIILTERKQLLGQTGKELEQFDINPYYITDKTQGIPAGYDVFVCMPISLRNRLEKSEYKKWASDIDSIYIDECHRTHSDWVFDNPILKDKFIFGFTGSPRRSGKQRQLGEMYTTMAIGPTTVELESQKWVAPLKIFKVPSDIMDGCESGNTANGFEFNNADMFSRFDSPTVYKGAVENWQKFTPDTLTMVYNCNIVHAIKTCLAFNKAGIKSKFLTSAISKPAEPDWNDKSAVSKYNLKLDNYLIWKENYPIYGGEREEILSQWGKDFLVLQNVDFFTFGYNRKDMVTAIINRGTMSLPLWIQMANRPCTKMEGKETAYLLDLGGNVDRLKEPNYPHEWSLYHETKKGGGVAGIKNCPKCDAMVLVSARVCPNPKCGFVFPKTKKEEFAELVEHKYSNQMYRDVDFSGMTFEEIEEYRKQKGYKAAWMFRTLYHQDRLKEYAKWSGKSHKWVYIQEKIYGK